MWFFLPCILVFICCPSEIHSITIVSKKPSELSTTVTTTFRSAYVENKRQETENKTIENNDTGNHTTISKIGTSDSLNATSINTNEQVVTFWEQTDYKGNSITRTYTDKCVNLGANWVYRAQSINTFGQCINVYTKIECEGDTAFIQNDEKVRKSLGKFSKKIASFRKCYDDNQRIKLGVRPQYIVTHFNADRSSNYSVWEKVQVLHSYVMSGVCTRLPNYADDKPSTIESEEQCLITYNKPGCKDGVRFHLAKGGRDFGYVYFKTCDLVFRNGCASLASKFASKCPKFITKGSVEYNFWKYLFSIYPRHYRRAFEERVNASKDGFISWEFLFPANTSAASHGDQYLDAIESQMEIFRALRSTQSGTLGFNEKHAITLRVLASQVYLERFKQAEDYGYNNGSTRYYDYKEERSSSHNHNLEVFRALETLWNKLDGVLGELANSWTSKRGDAKQRQLRFKEISYLNEESLPREILSTYEDKCVNMRSDWINKTCAIDTFGYCVTVYSELDCGGSSVNIYPLGKGYQDMIEVDFCQKTASFKKCDPITEIKFDERPVHHLHYNYYDRSQGSKSTAFKSNDCLILNDGGVFGFFFRCYVVFQDKNCQENPSYHYWPTWKDVKNIVSLNDGANSLQLCDLNVTQSNSCEWCPKKLLAKSSPEYVFWWYLFSIYSPKNRQQFANQFENSMTNHDGYIAWDFLFKSDETSATNWSLTRQYEDVLNNQFDMLRSLYIAVPGTMGFNVEQLEILSELASRVYEERRQNVRKGLEPLNMTTTVLESIDYGIEGEYLQDENDRYNVAFLTLLSMWAELQESLRKIIEHWNSENQIDTSHHSLTTNQEVTFWEQEKYKGANISFNYTHTCVNVNANWVNRVNSLDTGGKCIYIYAKTDCKGESVLLRDSLARLVNKIASFKKCDPKTLIKLDERPRYFVTIFDQADFHGQKENFGLLSGDCLTLPTNWHGRVSSLNTRQTCLMLFDSAECKGNIRYSFSSWMRQNDLRDANFQGKTKSIRTCEIKFESSCRQCPELIRKYSLEYNFWDTLFSVYSRNLREQFEERVERSYEGFISWDFILSSNTIAENFGDQYPDVLENHLRMFRVLRANRPGLLNFNSENVKIFLAMTRNIQKERKEQWLNMLKSGQDGTSSFIVLYYLETVWKSFAEALDDINRSWNGEDNIVDICGVVERKEQSEEPDLTDTLIYNGDPETYGDDPWHVAIYRTIKGKDPTLICGGTLISSSVVVSAAHCFYFKHLKTVLSNVTSEYEIYVGKYSLDYDAYDGPFQKRHEIAELIFNPKKYNPAGTKTFGSDIVLIILDKPVTVNSFVRPVCLDWDNTIFGSLLGNKPVGRIVGWGSVAQDDDTLEQSEYLRKAELTYVSHEECAGKTEHLSRDNFCGVSPKGDTGPSARKGDSGGGFVFKYKDRYYLRGIVSTRDKDSKSSINAFTDVSEYISWIRNYV